MAFEYFWVFVLLGSSLYLNWLNINIEKYKGMNKFVYIVRFISFFLSFFVTKNYLEGSNENLLLSAIGLFFIFINFFLVLGFFIGGKRK